MMGASNPSAVGGALQVGFAGDADLRSLGRLYQRAARRLGDRELRGFLLHQAEWLLHMPQPVGSATRSGYVSQTREYLQRVIALTAKPRHRAKVEPIRLVDDPGN
jgi:hypothetical protein